MPRAQRKPKRSAKTKSPKVKRSAKGKNPAKAKRILSHALDIEEPLNDALDFMQAFKQIGYGLISHGQDEGRPIVAVARAAEQRLKSLHDVWDGLFKAAKG